MEAINGIGSSLNLLPPGFRFCPTDEDLVLHFLHHKANSLSHSTDHHQSFSNTIIPDLQLHLFNPWQLHGKAFSNGDIHYFFTRVTESKATESGYWKDLEIDEPILCSTSGHELGIKKYHIFYEEAIQTTWVMQEYRLYMSSFLLGSSDNKPSNIKPADFGIWVLCRVFEARSDESGTGRSIFSCEEEEEEDNESELSFLDNEMYLSLDDVI